MLDESMLGFPGVNRDVPCLFEQLLRIVHERKPMAYN